MTNPYRPHWAATFALYAMLAISVTSLALHAADPPKVPTLTVTLR
jgi:hypothetical protein